jgi:hypothetical protein
MEKMKESEINKLQQLEETKHQVKGIETPKRDSIIHFFLN